MGEVLIVGGVVLVVGGVVLIVDGCGFGCRWVRLVLVVGGVFGRVNGVVDGGQFRCTTT